MIDVEQESLIRLHEARRLAWLKGRNGGRVDLSTLWRWTRRGVRGVVLETVKIGGANFTSVEAVHRFVDKLNCHEQMPSPRAVVVREISRADDRLDKLGII